MRQIFYYSLLVIALGFFSCQQEPAVVKEKKPRIFPEYSEALDEIIRSKEGVIRGIDLNSPASVITKTETKQPSEVDHDYLYFEYAIDSITSYSVAYNLKNDSLDEVDVEINCNDVDLSARLFTDLKTYYEKKLPNPTEDKGFVVYNCFEGQRKPFVVSLTDNSTPNKGIINLVIYRDK
ncbi:MAG: hypothetical protein K0S53_1832 [Bacteroidetes bacterium]|jgi:hypothetical protein|nr:hypothetical protein [Bacteroidota bacterium]MDF2451471.1 hypothetical protein [Bacteroidota bacterium]